MEQTIKRMKRTRKPVRRPIFWVIVCNDGCPHQGFRQMGTLKEAREMLHGIKGKEMTRLDDWGHPCKPHKIAKFVPEKK